MSDATEETCELGLYLLALCAQRETPSRTLIRRGGAVGVTGICLTMGTSVMGWCALADTPEEAKRIGLEVARAEWPESEGWQNHIVATSLIDRGYLAELLERMDEVTLSMVRAESEVGGVM